MIYRTLIFICLHFHSLPAQPVFINDPTEVYLQEIQLAKFPDQETATSGHAFFISDSSYYNQHIIYKVEDLLQMTSSKLYWYKFKKNRYRFTNYKIIKGETTYLETQNKKLFSDSTEILITADVNKRYWSWRYFKVKLRFIKRDTIYTGTIFSTNRIRSINKSPQVQIEAFDCGIKVLKNNEPYFIKVLNELTYTINYNLYDTSPQFKEVASKITYSRATIEIAKDSEFIIFCIPLSL